MQQAAASAGQHFPAPTPFYLSRAVLILMLVATSFGGAMAQGIIDCQPCSASSECASGVCGDPALSTDTQLTCAPSDPSNPCLIAVSPHSGSLHACWPDVPWKSICRLDTALHEFGGCHLAPQIFGSKPAMHRLGAFWHLALLCICDWSLPERQHHCLAGCTVHIVVTLAPAYNRLRMWLCLG